MRRSRGFGRLDMLVASIFLGIVVFIVLCFASALSKEYPTNGPIVASRYVPEEFRTVILPAGRKLEQVLVISGEFAFLTRPMREGEYAEKHHIERMESDWQGILVVEEVPVEQ